MIAVWFTAHCKQSQMSLKMMGHTIAFIQTIVAASGSAMVSVGKASDGDKPVALLYQRFSQQFLFGREVHFGR